jgi:kinesin family protein 1
MYQLKLGVTHVGRYDVVDSSNPSQISGSMSTSVEGVSTITLGGSNIQDDHCWFDNNDGVVTLHPKNDSLIMVNGMRISEPRELHSGYRIILGNYHIFRFNHPEEVRREREKAGSTPGLPTLASLSTDLHPMDLDNNAITTHERSDSPTTLASAPGGSELMDWNYARLEAVRNYYSKEGNFNGMKDDELEKLFDDITKIRKSRRSTRCGSLISFDDFSAQSTATDLETISTALTSTGSTTMSNLLGQNDYEEKITVEKERLQKELNEQKQFYEAKINRMSMQFSFSNGDNNGLALLDGGDVLMTDHQRDLLQKVHLRWKKLRFVAMAETVLTNAALLKEANIISGELEKEVSYQFTVIEDGQFTNPSSSWEPSYGLQQFNTDEDDDLLVASKPCVGIRVLDRKHQVIYTWSLEKFKTRLQQMKNLLNYRDQSVYRTHLNWEDPFYETPCPKYSFLGSAATSVRNLVLQKPYESYVEIICRSTGQVKGMLRVLISPVATTRSSQPPLRHQLGPAVSDNGTNSTSTKDDSFLPLPPQQKPNPSHLQVGQQLIFEVRMLELCGLHESEFTQVHVQFRLSSFGGIPADSTAEKLFATDPASGFEGLSILSLDYSQTLSMTVTSNMLDVLEHNMISFEVYGVASSRVLKQYERWDDQREKPRLADLLAAKNNSLGSDMDSRMTKTVSSSSPSSSSSTTTLPPQQQPPSTELSVPVERPSENDLIAVERHDVSAWLQISELLPNGDYMPVPTLSENSLDRGVFNLRQGLQRRITITLSHNSGRQFEWNRISKVTVGKIQQLDAKGRLIDGQSPEEIPIKLLAQQHAVTYNNDGTSQLVAQGAWDSSQHECLFLNRLTTARSRILLQVSWEVESEKCSKPILFSMEMAIRVTSRDSTSAGPTAAFRIKKLLGSASGTKYLNKCSGLFTIYLRPPMTRRVSQLWRLNTASKYIRGEEVFLGSWRPRGVSLINDYKHIRDRIRLKEQAAFTSQVLTLHAARSQTSHGAMTKEKYQKEHHQPDSTKITPHNNTKSDRGSDHDARQQDLLRKVLDLWMMRLGSGKDVS